MRRTRRWSAAVVALGLGVLIGCSGAGGEEAAPSPSAPPPSPSASPPPSSPPASPPAPPAATATPADSPAPATPTEAAGAFGDLADLADPAAAVAEAGLEVSGTPVAAASWNDANGQNLAVLSKSVEDVEEGETTRIFAAHHVIGDGETRRLREVEDFEEDCPFDTPAAFVAPVGEQTDELAALYNPWSNELAPGEVRGPLEVTDFDGDQLGELTFAYQLGCVSDVSPVSFKLLVLEDGEKYILRGQTWGGPRYAAEFEPLEAPEPEPAEADWPSAIWQHAIERHGLYAHD